MPYADKEAAKGGSPSTQGAVEGEPTRTRPPGDTYDEQMAGLQPPPLPADTPAPGAADAPAPAGPDADVAKAVEGLPGYSEEGSCKQRTEGLAGKVLINSEGKVRPDRVYNDMHYYLRVGETIIDPTASQFVNWPVDQPPPVLVGTPAQIQQQLGDLVAKYGIRYENRKQAGTPFLPKSIKDADALYKMAYDGGTIREYGGALVTTKSGRRGYYDSGKNKEIKAQKEAEAAAKAAQDKPAAAPTKGKPKAQGDGETVTVHPIVDVGAAPKKKEKPKAQADGEAVTAHPIIDVGGPAADKKPEAAAPPKAPAPPKKDSGGSMAVRNTGLNADGLGTTYTEAEGIEGKKNDKGEVEASAMRQTKRDHRVKYDMEKGELGYRYQREDDRNFGDEGSQQKRVGAGVKVGANNVGVELNAGETLNKPGEPERATNNKVGMDVGANGVVVSAERSVRKGPERQDNKELTYGGSANLGEGQFQGKVGAARTGKPGEDSDGMQTPAKKTSVAASGGVDFNKDGTLEGANAGLDAGHGNVKASVGAGFTYKPGEPAYDPKLKKWVVIYNKGDYASVGGGYKKGSVNYKSSSNMMVKRVFATEAQAKSYADSLKKGRRHDDFEDRALALQEGEELSLGDSDEKGAGLSGNVGAANVGVNVGQTNSREVSLKAGKDSVTATIMNTETIKKGFSASALVGMGLNDTNIDGFGIIVRFKLPEAKAAYHNFVASKGAVIPAPGPGVTFGKIEKTGNRKDQSVSIPGVTGAGFQEKSDTIQEIDGKKTHHISGKSGDSLKGSKVAGQDTGPNAGSNIGYDSTLVNGKAQGGNVRTEAHSDDAEDMARRTAATTGHGAANTHVAGDSDTPAPKVTTDVRVTATQEDKAIQAIIDGRYNPYDGGSKVTTRLVAPMKKLRGDLKAAKGNPTLQRQLLRDFLTEHKYAAGHQLRQAAGVEAIPKVEGHEDVFGGNAGYNQMANIVAQLEQRVANNDKNAQGILDEANRLKGKLNSGIAKLTDTKGYLSTVPPGAKKAQISRFRALDHRLNDVVSKATDLLGADGKLPPKTPERVRFINKVVKARKQLSSMRKKASSARTKALHHHNVHNGHGMVVSGPSAKDRLTNWTHSNDDANEAQYKVAEGHISDADRNWTDATNSFGKIPALSIDTATTEQLKDYLQKLQNAWNEYNFALGAYRAASNSYSALYAANKEGNDKIFTGYDVTEAHGTTIDGDEPWDAETGRTEQGMKRKRARQQRRVAAADAEKRKKVQQLLAQANKVGGQGNGVGSDLSVKLKQRHHLGALNKHRAGFPIYKDAANKLIAHGSTSDLDKKIALLQQALAGYQQALALFREGLQMWKAGG